MPNEPIEGKTDAPRMTPRLRAAIEQLSGRDMSDLTVHENSSEPARVTALAFTQGSQIHIAPGDAPLNDDVALEREADVMGQRAEKHKHEMKR